MPKLRVLSGQDVVDILITFGFVVKKQRGSHVKISRETPTGKQVIGVPLHSELDKGTERAIYTQALKYISETELRKKFYTN